MEKDVAKDGKKSGAKEKEGGGMGSYFRVFKYADRVSWTLNVIAFLAAIAAGTLLPLMDLVFGKFVSISTRFALNIITPAQYRSEVNKYTCVLFIIVEGASNDNPAHQTIFYISFYSKVFFGIHPLSSNLCSRHPDNQGPSNRFHQAHATAKYRLL